MTVYKVVFYDISNEAQKTDFVLSKDILDFATQFTKHHEPAKYRLLKVEYIGAIRDSEIK